MARQRYAARGCTPRRPADTVRRHLQHAELIELAADAVLLEPGAQSRGIYLVLPGELSTRLLGENRDEVMRIGPGDCIGEQSIIDDRRAASFAVARTHTRVILIAPARFRELMCAESTIALNLVQILSERIRRNNAALLEGMTRQLQFQLSRTTDALTGMRTRAWMEQMYARCIARAEHSGSALALMMFAVDAPHAANDQVSQALPHVAGIATHHLRPGDLCVRYAEDVLCALLPDANAGRAKRAAERLREAVHSAPLLLADGRTVSLTASFGAAEWRAGCALTELADSAQGALVQARKRGGNTVVLCDSGVLSAKAAHVKAA